MSIFAEYVPRIDYIHPLPWTVPLTPLAAALPPLLYYVALVLLPPFPSNPVPRLTAISRNVIALLALLLFLRLPFRYYLPFSVGLTYQLALVGQYGAARICDTFFISRYLIKDVHIPRRVIYTQVPRTPKAEAPGPDADSYFSLHFLLPNEGAPITEHAESQSGLPTSTWDRLSWALELELAMRGAGFAWSSADIRHSKRTWSPSVADRVHSIILHVLPLVLASWAIIRGVQQKYLAPSTPRSEGEGVFDELPYLMQAVLTASLGAFLMAVFSLGHSIFAILLSTLRPHPLSYFPSLYSKKVWEICSVREFWSYGWHRLFSRLFLVYGVWPGEMVERALLRKSADEPADVGKVLGAFLSSGVVHSLAGYTVVPGGLPRASAELWFFVENGIAVIVEESVRRIVIQSRKKTDQSQRQGDQVSAPTVHRWYDLIVGKVWWIFVLLYTGRNFARGKLQFSRDQNHGHRWLIIHPRLGNRWPGQGNIVYRTAALRSLS